MALPSFNGMLQATRAKQAATEIRAAFQETQRQSIRGKSSCQTDIDIPVISVGAPVIRGNCMTNGEVNLPNGVTLVTNVLPSPTSATSRRDELLPWERNIHTAGITDIVNNVIDTACAVLPGLPYICPQDDELLPGSSPSGQPFPSASGQPYPSNSPSIPGQPVLPSDPKLVSIQFGRLGAARFQVAQDPTLGSSQDYSAKFISVRPNHLNARKPCVVLSGSLGLTRLGTYHGDLDPLSITTDGVCQVKHWTEQK